MPHKRTIPRVCQQCSALFLAYAHQVKKGKDRFCSDPCRRLGGNYGRPFTPLADRFWSRIEKTDTCWLWTGPLMKNGYGTIGAGGRSGGSLLVHRFSWELHNGPIPEGMEVCHTCDVRKCINPQHLWLGSHAENVADMISKTRQPRGEQRWNVKLTADKVLTIRARHKAGETQVSLAHEFGVDKLTIWGIVHRKSWKHVA